MRGRTPALWLVLGLLAAGPGWPQDPPAVPAPPEAAVEAEEEAPAGPIVTAIEVRSEAPLDENLELENVIELAVGAPLAEEDVRHTLRNLQASGIASEVELYTQDDPAGGGVVAIIVLRPLVQVEEVRIVGELGLSGEDLRRAIPQGESEPLSEEQVLRGVYALRDLYEQSGYFQASVRVAVGTAEERRQAVVTYTVDSGPRAAVRTVAFSQPVAPLDPGALVEQLRLKPGEPYSRRLAREDAERLQTWLARQGYRAARVDPPQETLDPQTNDVSLTFPIEIGPRIEIRVEGADEGRLRRRGLLRFLDEGGYDEALLLQASSRIRSDYQQQGHYDVRVDTREERADGQLQVILAVEPGPQYTLAGIDLQGNEEIADDELRGLMVTSERSLLRPGSGRLVQSELDADIENIRRYYALQGYTQAKVGPAQVEKQGDSLRLAIPILEGPRQRVVNLRFEGMEALDPATLRAGLPLREGGGFHPVLLENTLDQLRASYVGQGYVQAQVSARQDWNPGHTLVDVTIEVLEGPRQVADRVIVRGNQRTRTEVIRRTIDLDPGEPISPVKLLEIERDLYRLGIFSRVEVDLVRGGLDVDERDILVRVEEGRPRALTYGLGVEVNSGESDGFDELAGRGLLSFTHNNVAGRAYSLRSDLRYSTRNEGLFRLTFNQPYLRQYPVSLTSAAFYERTEDLLNRRRRPYEVATQFGARTEAARVFSDRRVSLGLDYRNVDLDEIDFGVGALPAVQSYQVTSLVPNFFWDRRNDPISATRGWSSLFQAQYAFPLIEDEAAFLKLSVQQTQYLDLGRPGVLAASVRVGGINPLTSLAPLAGDPAAAFRSRDVPIPERLFAGGDNTHRAFAPDELGIEGESLVRQPGSGRYDDFVPAGGNGLFLFNLDYRFPVFGDFGGTVFFDSGNVWGDWQRIDLGDLRHGAGLEVRYLSPLGPIRAGIGWKLNREEREEPRYWFVNIGSAF